MWIRWTLIFLLAAPAAEASKPRDATPASSKAAQASPAARPTPKAAAKAAAKASAKAPDPRRLEWGVLPALNYDSDTGFGFGVIFSLAKFQPGFTPYQWRLEVLLYMTVKESVSKDGVEFPYHDDYIMLDMPGLFGGALRLNSKLRFGRFSNASYYGLGNAAQSDPQLFKERFQNRYYQYDRIYPSGELNARIALFKRPGHRLELFVGGRFTYNWINAFDDGKRDSKLKDDLAGKNGTYIQGQMIGSSDHGELLGQLGLIYDSRDHEYAPKQGMFHELSMRIGQGFGAPFTYGGVNLTGRFYLSIYKEYLVLAARLMGDLLFGQVPFYELARHGGLFPSEATGGGKSVRGILTQRFHGRVKILGNVELRSKFLPFRIGSERFNVGALAFFDTGRIWADLQPHPQLDGEGPGFKMGFGGGLRLQWGETFLVRADVAYSPTDDNIGVYIDINHVF